MSLCFKDFFFLKHMRLTLMYRTLRFFAAVSISGPEYLHKDHITLLLITFLSFWMKIKWIYLVVERFFLLIH